MGIDTTFAILDLLRPLPAGEAVHILDAVSLIYEVDEATCELASRLRRQPSVCAADDVPRPPAREPLPKPHAKSAKLDASILQALKSSEQGMSPAEIEAAIDGVAKYSQIRYRLGALCDRGLVTATGATMSRRYVVSRS